MFDGTSMFDCCYGACFRDTKVMVLLHGFDEPRGDVYDCLATRGPGFA